MCQIPVSDLPTGTIQHFNIVIETFICHWVNHGWLGGMVPVVRLIGGIFLCRKWPRRVDPTGEATEGVSRPHWPLRLVRPKDEH